jgi:hypothetical protein
MRREKSAERRLDQSVLVIRRLTVPYGRDPTDTLADAVDQLSREGYRVLCFAQVKSRGALLTQAAGILVISLLILSFALLPGVLLSERGSIAALSIAVAVAPVVALVPILAIPLLRVSFVLLGERRRPAVEE